MQPARTSTATPGLAETAHEVSFITAQFPKCESADFAAWNWMDQVPGVGVGETGLGVVSGVGVAVGTGVALGVAVALGLVDAVGEAFGRR
jgi:hypothetical protein